MSFETTRLDNIEEFLSRGVPLIPGVVLYRGVSDADYELIPSVGRLLVHKTKPQRELYEKQLLEEFKRKGVAYTDISPADDWEWLFLAQHHRLPTRLLDWTTSPLFALHFAMNSTKNKDKDFAVYQPSGIAQNLVDNYGRHFPQGPLHVKGNFSLTPRYLHPRVERQGSVFTIQEDPWSEFTDPNPINKYVFPASARKPGMRKLQSWGITNSVLMPGLDSLAKDIKFAMDAKHDY